jgi:hypothetical protein
VPSGASPFSSPSIKAARSLAIFASYRRC